MAIKPDASGINAHKPRPSAVFPGLSRFFLSRNLLGAALCVNRLVSHLAFTASAVRAEQGSIRHRLNRRVSRHFGVDFRHPCRRQTL